MKALLPPDATWGSVRHRPRRVPMVAQAVLLGGHVRVGLEDNFFLDRGVQAKTNAELVEKAGRLVRMLGAELATPAQAREILGPPGGSRRDARRRRRPVDSGRRSRPGISDCSASPSPMPPRAGAKLVALPEFATFLHRSGRAMAAAGAARERQPRPRLAAEPGRPPWCVADGRQRRRAGRRDSERLCKPVLRAGAGARHGVARYDKIHMFDGHPAEAERNDRRVEGVSARPGSGGGRHARSRLSA